MGTGKRRISTAVAPLEPIALEAELVIGPAVSAGPAVRVGLAELVVLAVLEVLVELVVLAVLEVLVELVVLAGLVVREALAELAIVPAAVQALAIDRVAVRAQPIAPAEAEPEAARVALPAKIRSATAPHRHGQVRVPKKAVALAAAAETTREQAATEAAKAWVVVG
jgi:hypothetical protein